MTKPTARPLPQLPLGGRVLFPAYRVVAFYGAPGVPNMGILGAGTARHEGAALAQRALLFEQKRRAVLPAFELIATMAQRWPGLNHCYCAHQDDATIRSYLKEARRLHGLLILDVQPGRAEFLPEVRRYEAFLAQPDVGLAMDSEWRMDAAQMPGDAIGHVNAREINAVSSYLAGIVRRHRLPQKLLVIHQFAAYMIDDRQAVTPHPELAITFHIDGFGSRAVKLKTYHDLASSHGRFFNGLKLFFEQDLDMFSVREVLAFRPVPDLITYQ
ncbi:MAG TPA: hypothetical protein VKR99_01690 [Candidatus Eremiobacteraceae bacterium]|nr:hypothetical protein [Candidatus Eremiobacteraceae bacterium]